MHMQIDVYHHWGNDAPQWAREMRASLNSILKKDITIMQELDNLTAAVTASTTVQDSAMVLLTGLKTALDAAIAGGNPAALQALSDSLGSESTKMAAAITANTPAASGGGPAPASSRR